LLAFMISSPRETRPATLEDLAALNREMAALVAAGLPLEEGLRQVARDYGRGVGSLAERLADEMAAGKSLDEAIVAQGDELPAIYRAVVLAGLKSGRLGAALEGFAESAARVAVLRRIAGQAAVYPLLVVVVAWLMLLATICLVMPSYDWLEWNDRFWISSLAMSGRTAQWLAIFVPLGVATIAVVWWRRSSRWSSAGSGGWLRAVPGARRAALLSGQANFAELLQLMLSCSLPLPEALRLAGDASGSSTIRRPAAELAAAIAAGKSPRDERELVRQLPALVRPAFLSTAPDAELRLAPSLEHAAAVYRRRAAAWVDEMSVIAPVAATLLVGVTVAATYAVVVWQPYVVSLDAIAQWDWH
jgi:general secretion pathway protein F